DLLSIASCQLNHIDHPDIQPPICLALFLLLPAPPPIPTLFPYTTLFRSETVSQLHTEVEQLRNQARRATERAESLQSAWDTHVRSEEHTSELQSRFDLVCRLLLEKKKN